MSTDCNATQLNFEGFEGRRGVGGAVTSNVGATLLREANLAIGLTAKVARRFRDERAGELVVHRIETLVAQRVHAIARVGQKARALTTKRSPFRPPAPARASCAHWDQAIAS